MFVLNQILHIMLKPVTSHSPDLQFKINNINSSNYRHYQIQISPPLERQLANCGLSSCSTSTTWLGENTKARFIHKDDIGVDTITKVSIGKLNSSCLTQGELRRAWSFFMVLSCFSSAWAMEVMLIVDIRLINS